MKDINKVTGGNDTKESKRESLTAQGRFKLAELFDYPEELEYYREEWKERIRHLSSESKEKIIRAVEKIQVNFKRDNKYNRFMEFKLGNKNYKILDTNIRACSDEDELQDERFIAICRPCRGAYLGGMMGDDVDGWKNQNLKEFVKEKQNEGLHIAKIEEIKNLLGELGKEADLNDESDQIAMLMYLTGMESDYWLSMGNNESSGSENLRSKLNCGTGVRNFCYSEQNPYAGLCMISIE